MANVVSGFRIGMWVILVKCHRSELQRALCEDLIVLTALCISQVYPFSEWQGSSDYYSLVAVKKILSKRIKCY